MRSPVMFSTVSNEQRATSNEGQASSGHKEIPHTYKHPQEGSDNARTTLGCDTDAARMDSRAESAWSAASSEGVASMTLMATSAPFQRPENHKGS